MTKPIDVLGLGLMGTAITERLIEFGYPVRIWNRTREKVTCLSLAVRSGATIRSP